MVRDDHASFLTDISTGAAPTLDAAGALTRWDPWVRATVAVTELTQQLVYVAAPPDTYEVKVRLAGGSLPTLAKLTRPNINFFKAQLSMVQSWAELRDERAPEVLAQIDNQFAFIAAVTGLHVTRKKWTMEWLLVAIQYTIQVEMRFKHAFACYRPVEFSPQVQPIITTPGHSAYPMGHAAQAFALVVALAGLLKIPPAHAAYTQLTRQARRISVNRVVAGVHFPIDAHAGHALGLALGEFFLCVGNAGGQCFGREFAPTGAGSDTANDFLGEGATVPPQAEVIGITASPYLSELTKRARAEWGVDQT